jgi:mRNA interferase HigB
VRIIAEKKLKDFASLYPDAKMPLERWVTVIKSLKLDNLNQIKDFFGSADVISKNRVIFNIGGNKFRLVTGIFIARQGKKDIIYTIWIGTHSEYDKIDAVNI